MTKYIHASRGINRHERRKANAIALHEPTEENLKLNDAIQRMVSKPYRNPERATRPKGKKGRALAKVMRALDRMAKRLEERFGP